MSSLYIDDYSVEDLLELFELDEYDLEELNEDIINRQMLHLMNTYKELGQREYMLFLHMARNKILEAVKEIKIQQWYEQQDGQDHIEQRLKELMEIDKENEVDEDDVKKKSNDNKVDEDNENDEKSNDEEKETDENEQEKNEKELDTYNETSFMMNQYKDDIPITNHTINRKYSSHVLSNQNHHTMIPNKLPIQEQYQVPLIRGQLNPTLKNITSRVLHIDSKFRINQQDSSEDFIIDLYHPLSKVLNLKLLSYEIPLSWYLINEYTDLFRYYEWNESEEEWIEYNVHVPHGNYNIEDLLTILNDLLPSDISITYLSSLNKTQLDISSNSSKWKIDFLKENDYHLGWLLGFRKKEYEKGTWISESMINLYGTRYVYLSVDDYQHNHLNHSVICASEYTKQVKLPSYFHCGLSGENPMFLKDTDQQGNPVRSSLTMAQAFTIQQIQQEQKEIEIRGSRNMNIVSHSDILGKIPVEKRFSQSQGIHIQDGIEIMIGNGGSLQYNQRTFFGPVDIKKIRVRLYDEYGHLISMNHQDFSFTLLVEQLYKY